nr:sporulation transcriptional regulator SpoIIID [Ruminococcus sp.]
KISPQLFKSVKEVLEENKRERHIRGGIATKHKYEQQFKKAVK